MGSLALTPVRGARQVRLVCSHTLTMYGAQLPTTTRIEAAHKTWNSLHSILETVL